MKTLIEHLAQYAEYHRDHRNIVTHLFGVPLIVVSVAALLARASFEVAGVSLSAATVVTALAALFYLSLELRVGLLMAVLMALTLAFGQWAAGLPLLAWLAVGVGGFVIGWIIQFVGHYYEGRKPAFVDDVTGLAIGPLFVAVEFLFLLGLRHDLRDAIAERAGPVRG